MSLSFKSSGLVVALGLVLSLSSPASAAVWRSQSGKTAIRGLDSICWGNSNLYTVHTAFGNTFYSGSASFNYVRNNGCEPGDTLIGNFNLKSANSDCDGTLTVTWQRGNNAYLKWDIANPGYNGCPVTNAHWEINTYPVADGMARPITSPTGAAFVFAPPSNVRASPNGTIICSVRSATTINLYGQSNGWYKTDACGTMGFIHHSQIRF